MAEYNADQIIGKSLIGKKQVEIKRSPYSSSPVVYKTNTGDTVGVVYSWIQNADGLWWMFYDNGKKPYYVLHEQGKFDINSLQNQGTKTTDEVAKEEAEKKEKEEKGAVLFYVEKYGPWVAGILLLATLGPALINKLPSKK